MKMVCCLPHRSDAKKVFQPPARWQRASFERGREGKGSAVGKQEAPAFAPFPSVRTEREPRSKLRDSPLLCFSLGQMKSCSTKNGPRLSIAVACEHFCASHLLSGGALPSVLHLSLIRCFLFFLACRCPFLYRRGLRFSVSSLPSPSSPSPFNSATYLPTYLPTSLPPPLFTP